MFIFCECLESNNKTNPHKVTCFIFRKDKDNINYSTLIYSFKYQ